MKEWLAYADTLPDFYNDVAARMRAMKPKYKEDGVIEVVCENQQVVKFMQEISSGLLQYLCNNIGYLKPEIDFKADETYDETIDTVEEFKRLLTIYRRRYGYSVGLNSWEVPQFPDIAEACFE